MKIKIFILIFIVPINAHTLELERKIQSSNCINDTYKYDNNNIKIDENHSVCANKIKIEKKIEIKKDISVKKNSCISIGNIGKQSGC